MRSHSSRALVGGALLVLLSGVLLFATPSLADTGLRGRALLQKKKSSPSPVRSPSPSSTTASSPATGLVFPPLCNCERTARKSPFRMSLDTAASAGGIYCFTIQNVGGCDPKQKCCDGKQGVSKVEIDVGE